MAGSRTRNRRRQSFDAIVCAGHQELRDIVIRTDENVQHILESLAKGSETMAEHDERISVLETAEATRKEVAKSKKETRTSIFNSRTTVISIIIGAAGVVVAAIAIIW